MRAVRQYIDAPLRAGGSVELTDAALQRLVRVLRMAAGDEVLLFNGDGHDYRATLRGIGKRQGEAGITEQLPVQRESPLRITLAQALARGEKMDLILQKAVELGVSDIAPLSTERTEVRLDAERSDRRMQHWRGVIAGACEQCGRARLPELAEPRTLADFAASIAAQSDGGARRVALDPQGSLSLAALDLAEGEAIVLVIGPEGGLSPRDLAVLKAARFEGLRMGPRILRTETAGLAALAALNALYGDWR